MRNKTKYQRKFRIHQGDKVMVMAGRARGETGEIEEIDLKRIAFTSRIPT
jgi:ribosomal protein L24